MAELEVTMEEWLQLCYKRPDVFAHYYFDHIIRCPSSKFHFLLYDLIYKINQSNYSNRVAIAAPRGNAKTQIIHVILPIWCIAFEQKKYIVMVSDTSRAVEANLESIKYELTTNEKLAEHFPHIVGEGPKWKKEEIDTNNNVRIVALGAGKQLRGTQKKGARRPDAIHLDDLENDEHVNTKAQRDKLEDWLTKVILGMEGAKEEGYKMDVILTGTIIHPKSLLAKLVSPSEFLGWDKHLFKAVYKDSKSPLWQTWKDIYTNYSDSNRIETAELFFNTHKKEMLEGVEVLWPEGDPYYRIQEYKINAGIKAYSCFKQGTPIILEDYSFKNIEDIKEGDKVITKDGSSQKVTYVNSRYTDSDIYKIKIAGVSQTIEATEEHPFLIWPQVKYKQYILNHQHLSAYLSGFNTEYKQQTVNNRILTNETRWKFAKDINVGDAVIMPLPPKVQGKHLCDPDWWWLIGYYLAEGWTSTTNNTVNFAAHIDEIPYFNEVIRISKKYNYGQTFTIREGSSESDKVITLTFSSPELSQYLKLYGKGAKNKHLPYNEIKCLCKDCFSSLWGGYIAGDGYDIRGYKGVNSISWQLLHDFQIGWLRHREITYMYKMKDHGEINFRGKTYSTQPLWSLQKIETKRAKQVWIYEENLYSKIQKIERVITNQPTKVYGISVDVNHNYTIPNAVVKNSEKQNNPIDPSSVLFDTEKIVYYNRSDIDLDTLIIYGAIDPASGDAKKKGDLTAIVTIGKSPKTGIMYVLDVKADNTLSPSDSIKYIKRMHELYDYRYFGIDSDALKLYKDLILREVPSLMGKLKLYNLRVNKRSRIDRLEPPINSGLIQIQKTQYELLDELMHFPKSEYDDVLDALEIASTVAGNRKCRILTY